MVESIAMDKRVHDCKMVHNYAMWMCSYISVGIFINTGDQLLVLSGGSRICERGGQSKSPQSNYNAVI